MRGYNVGARGDGLRGVKSRVAGLPLSSEYSTKTTADARWPRLSGISPQNAFTLFPIPSQAGVLSSSLSLSLSSLELSDTKVYAPYIRARLGTAAHFCEVVVVTLRTGRGGCLQTARPWSCASQSRFVAPVTTCSARFGSQFENTYFTEMCSGSEAGSNVRLVDFCTTRL